MQNMLDKLGIEAVNPGACWGPNGWSAATERQPIISDNPTTGADG